MRRLIVVVVLAAGFVGLWWLADDGRLRERLVGFSEQVLNRATGEPPSWGDVAERVGAFASEERDLKETVGSLGGGPDSSDEAAPKTEGPDE
ncbi:MAG: hypothetical protein GY798_25040 [Hyphomicrobiales bacterium]|nr:hypothetical protein [Hyphomicrobiales bacterium]